MAHFSDLGLNPTLLRALDEVGYETPSPIQAQTIPHLLEGKDVLGQAQTGTGKTAAFALPLLSKIAIDKKPVQVLVLTPTRELAIQVAEALQKYAKYVSGFRVLPVYGGQDYRGQIRALERGVHVVVGTPGRVMDHMRRGTLKLNQLNTLVLDEADEMLRMGFIDDVQWILDQTPEKRQIALFSATMPPQIRRIATRHLKNPVHVTVKNKAATSNLIRQRYIAVTARNKLDALTRILEAETFGGVIVFVRTKTLTLELADKLKARGYATAALNGDIPQNQRERTIAHLKESKTDIIVATDVAARGLDVERVSHVINYDIPTDVESYIHRIGRTGRAGRQGDAILFVSPRERHLHRAIEKGTSSSIKAMDLPSNKLISERRVARFKQKITEALARDDLAFFEDLIQSYCAENAVAPEKVSAALAHLVQGDLPFLTLEEPSKPRPTKDKKGRNSTSAEIHDKAPVSKTGGHNRKSKSDRVDSDVSSSNSRPMRAPETGMERFRLAVGTDLGVKPGNIVGAIANEAGIDSQYIGQIQINADHSLIDLPEGMPKAIFKDLQKTRVCGVPLRISRNILSNSEETSSRPSRSGKSNSSGTGNSDSSRRGKSNASRSGKSSSKSNASGGGKFNSKPKNQRNKTNKKHNKRKPKESA